MDQAWGLHDIMLGVAELTLVRSSKHYSSPIDLPDFIEINKTRVSPIRWLSNQVSIAA